MNKNNKKQTLTKRYPNNTVKSAKAKEFLKKRYNVKDNNLTVIISSRTEPDDDKKLTKSTFYFQFKNDLNREIIDECVNKSLMSMMMLMSDITKMELSDSKIKKILIIASRKHHQIIKTYIADYHKNKEYMFIYKLTPTNNKK